MGWVLGGKPPAGVFGPRGGIRAPVGVLGSFGRGLVKPETDALIRAATPRAPLAALATAAAAESWNDIPAPEEPGAGAISEGMVWVVEPADGVAGSAGPDDPFWLAWG